MEEWSRKVFAENEQDEWPISWGPDEGQESPVSDENRIFFSNLSVKITSKCVGHTVSY